MIKYADYIHLSTGFPSWNVAKCINTGIYAAVDCEIRVVYKGTGENTDRIAGFTYNEVGGGAGDSNDFRLLGYVGQGGYDVYSSRFTGFGSTTTNNQEYDYTMYNNYLVDNKTSSIKCSGATQPMNTNCTIRVDVSSIYLNRLEIKNGGVVVFDGYAALDTSTNTVGLYDKISKQMLNSGLSLTYDNLINTFIIDPDNITFSYDSGSTTVNISAEGGWTASTLDSWITLSDATGTGESAITVTVPDNYNNSTNRIGTVTFTNGEEVLTLTITQKADTRVILKNIYRSGNSVKQMYRSGVKIYQQLMKLTFDVDTDSITFDNTGGTYTINITANEKWTMTVPNWLNASSISGTGNASIIISTNSVPQDRLEGQIIINCTNKTHSIAVTQKASIHLVNYIHKSQMSWNLSNNINTGIYASTDCEIRVRYMGKAYNVDRIAGFAPNEGATDSTDFRLFYYTSGSLDVMNQRKTNLVSGGIMVNNTVYDFTFGNNFVYDNLTETEIYRGTSVSSMNTGAPIRVDVGGIWLNRIQIKKGGVLVFDGKAAVNEGQGCLYDSVTGTYFTNTGFQITYDE